MTNNKKEPILYVDDEIENLDGFKFSFMTDYDISVAQNATEGLKILEQKDIKIVISDQRMPKISGIEFLKTVKEKFPDTIRIVLTAYADKENAIEAINKGEIYRYLSKPWDKTDLKSTIDNAIESYNLKYENKLLLNSLKTSNFKLRQINNQLNESILKVEESKEKLQAQNEEYAALNEEYKTINEELLKANKKTEESKNRFHKLFEQNPVSLWEEDLSVLKQTLDKVKPEIKDLKKYLDNNPDFVADCATKIIIRDVNKVSLNLFKVKNKEELISFLGKTFNQKSFETFKKLLLTIAADITEFSEETEYVKSDGEIFPAIIKIDFSSNYRESIVSIIDISKQKNAEQALLVQNEEYAALNEEYKTQNEELIEAIEKAEESDHLKSEFINNMSHEIRTPMNGILGFSGFLNNDDLSNEKRKYYVNIIQNSGNQLMRIIDDILEISKLGTKQVKTVEKQICLNDLLLEQFSIFDIKAKELNIPLYLKKGLTDKESIIYTDETKLNKILGNLLENSLKFTSEGYIEFGYILVETRHGVSIQLYVKDTGVGIRPEKQETIFERFSQAEKKLSEKVGGLGLGLSIAKENAELLGGKITLSSEKDNGATFYVTIPYRRDDSGYETKNQAFPTNKEVLGKQVHTILIVEDEEVNCLFIETLLEGFEQDYKTIHAKHGQEALEICKENNGIDLILMDLKMPVMNGFEATSLIKEFMPDLPIIAQTAYSTRTEKQKAIAVGCDDFISKPIDEEVLKETISKYLTISKLPPR